MLTLNEFQPKAILPVPQKTIRNVPKNSAPYRFRTFNSDWNQLIVFLILLYIENLAKVAGIITKAA